MTSVKISDLTANDAKKFFLKGSSYFNGDFPSYINFELVLRDVEIVLKGNSYSEHKSKNPASISGVNYSFVANKDGRFAWRPYELMHPAVYVSLVNLICTEENWLQIVSRLNSFNKDRIICCSHPLQSLDNNKDQAAQVSKWWQTVEQKSLELSLEYNHVLHTDVSDCYGSLYTHSIAWALHGFEKAKESKEKKKGKLLGDSIDALIRAGRYGQTNGISQGSVLMDFIAELVLGYVDDMIDSELENDKDFHILRYRDDYRIFTHNDAHADEILKIVSDKLRSVGMRLNATKTMTNANVVEGSIKPDKLAGLDLQDLGVGNAKTLQKQLLRIHSFGRRYPNSGALRRLLSELHVKIIKNQVTPDDLEVQVAIATDIAVISPSAFPAVAGILSHMISSAPKESKTALWNKVHKKMSKVPNNGYLEVWLQRVTKPKSINIEYDSKESICRIVNGMNLSLWDNSWISCKTLLNALACSKIVVQDATEISEVIPPTELALFKKNAWYY